MNIDPRFILIPGLILLLAAVYWSIYSVIVIPIQRARRANHLNTKTGWEHDESKMHDKGDGIPRP